jgi:undecaprenyl-phosphate 4-deoxy-4-formamido-L-arabinose transferase
MKPTRSPSLTVVIPVYNSEPILETLIQRLAAVLPEIAGEYEVILINDGSRDESWAKITRLCAATPWLRGIHLSRNYGQHNALLCGLRAARGEVTVTMDDDLQHPPEEIAHLTAKLAEGWDVVYGVPRQEQHGLWRDLASQVTKLALQSAMGAQTARHVSAFRAFHTRLRDSFAAYQNSFVSIDVLLTWGSTRFAAVQVEHRPRLTGASNYTFRKLARHALNMVTGFSILPLQIASLMGFLFAFFGALVLVYVVGRYLIQGGSVPGFPFLASTIAIFSGVQLFALGIIGEYLARMHFRLMDRPPYVIREATPPPDPAP